MNNKLRAYKKWKSPSVGKEMEMLIFGNRGTPVIVFPSENGRFFEWEDRKVINQFEEQVEKGYNQFFCVDSLAGECFLNGNAEPCSRMMRHHQYILYILDEVLPYISTSNSNPFLINAGVGLGAYYSLLLALKYPRRFHKVLGFAGYYNIKQHLDGFYDDNVYFNNPVDFIPNLNDLKILKDLSALDIRLLSYSNDRNKDAGREMSDKLWTRFIEHQFYIWEEETDDSWSLVSPMFKEHLI